MDARISRRPKRAGVALLTALFFGVLCLGLAVGFLLEVPTDLSATVQLEQDTKASYVAEAALQDTMAWLSHELVNLREPCTSTNPNPLRNGSLDGWTWSCRVEPDSGTPPNSLTSLRIYRLTATASRDGRDIYRIVADVQGGQSFARFSIFIDNDGYITYDFLATPDSQVQGPVHKNRPIRFLVSPSLLGASPSSSSFPFDSVISTTASDHRWHSGGTMTTQLSENQYDNILRNGSADLLYGLAPRLMPTDSIVLASAAWGSVPPATAPPGVTVNAIGGIYIAGDVTSMQMDTNSNGDFVLTVDQGGQVTSVIEDSANNQRLVTDPGGTTISVAGLGTGVIFCSGHIRALSGENKGAHTIATQFEAGKDLEISGSITRADTTVGTVPTTTDDRLGIVASKITIADESVLPRSVSSPLRIYATLMATDILEVKDRFVGNPGAMAIYGGMASDKAWATVDFNNLTELRTTSGYGGLSGYGSANIYYDKLLADEPPPEYPTTAPADFSIRSWREQPL